MRFRSCGNKAPPGDKHGSWSPAFAMLTLHCFIFNFSFSLNNMSHRKLKSTTINFIISLC